MQKEREEYNTETLEKIFELEEENNTLLKKLDKYQKINTALKILYWVIILVSVFGAYFAFKPFVSSITDGGINFDSISKEAENIPEVSKIKNIINNFGN